MFCLINNLWINKLIMARKLSLTMNLHSRNTCLYSLNAYNLIIGNVSILSSPLNKYKINGALYSMWVSRYLGRYNVTSYYFCIWLHRSHVVIVNTVTSLLIPWWVKVPATTTAWTSLPLLISHSFYWLNDATWSFWNSRKLFQWPYLL